MTQKIADEICRKGISTPRLALEDKNIHQKPWGPLCRGHQSTFTFGDRQTPYCSKYRSTSS